MQQLLEQGRLSGTGLRIIDRAKQNGSWTILDGVEALLIPADLEAAFQANPVAKCYFLTFNRSTRKAILQWLVLAKRAQTRQNRIAELIGWATQRQKPAALQWPKTGSVL